MVIRDDLRAFGPGYGAPIIVQPQVNWSGWGGPAPNYAQPLPVYQPPRVIHAPPAAYHGLYPPRRNGAYPVTAARSAYIPRRAYFPFNPGPRVIRVPRQAR